MTLGFASRGKSFAIVAVPDKRAPKPKKVKKWVWCAKCERCHYEGKHKQENVADHSDTNTCEHGRNQPHKCPHCHANRMWNDVQDDEAEALLDDTRPNMTIRERLEPIINALIELGLIEMADTLTEVVDEVEPAKQES